MEYFYPELALAYLLVQDIFNFKRILLSLKREYQLTAMISWGGEGISILSCQTVHTSYVQVPIVL